MTLEQIIVIAVVQGITEFLPISSSGHLILIPNVMHWPDQGIVVDVMTHLGTLLAVLIYFWRDVWRLIVGTLELFKGKVTDDGKLAIFIVLASLPAIAFGIFLKKFGYADLERNVAIVAWNTILYGILMLIADMVGPQERTIKNMTLTSALIIGVAQALALIPGTSRSGVTMTAARFLGFTRPELGALLLPARHSGDGGRHRFHRRRRVRERRGGDHGRGLLRGAHLRRRHSRHRLSDELDPPHQLPALRALSHGAGRLLAGAALRLTAQGRGR